MQQHVHELLLSIDARRIAGRSRNIEEYHQEIVRQLKIGQMMWIDAVQRGIQVYQAPVFDESYNKGLAVLFLSAYRR
jgi:hypothetical protein